MSDYLITLGGFHINELMANNKDTDYVYLTYKVGKTVHGPKHAKIGDLDKGDYVLDWHAGPVYIGDTDQWLMTYQIVNNGHGDDQAQLDKDKDITNKIAAGVAAVGSGSWVTTAAGIIAGVINVILSIFEGIDCDGVVLSDVVAGTGSTLQTWTSKSLTHTETRSYTGPDTGPLCGGNAAYTVTWAITRQPKWRGWDDFGALVTAGPSVASWGVNRLDLFVRGTDNSLYHDAWDGAKWSGWGKIIEGTFKDAPAAVSWGPSRIDVFVLRDDDHIGHMWGNGSKWEGWQDMGGTFSSGPAVASWGPDRLDLFAKGMNNALYHKAWDGAKWSEWVHLGGTFKDAPAAASWGNNRIDVCVRGMDDHVYHYWWG